MPAPSKKYGVHYYSADARSIVRTSRHATRELALRAIRRANAAGKIAALAETRMARDQPTCHH